MAVVGCKIEMKRRRFVVGRGSVGDDQEFASVRVAGNVRSAARSLCVAKDNAMDEENLSDEDSTARSA